MWQTKEEYLGAVVISDTVRQDVPAAIEGLRGEGVRRLVMLTGDKEEVGKIVAEKLGLDQVYGNLLPGDKVSRVESLLDEKPPGRTLAYVGDGINDAPVLARADIGIAMGGIGSDAAVEAADVVIMDDEPSKLVDTIRIARKTMGSCGRILFCHRSKGFGSDSGGPGICVHVGGCVWRCGRVCLGYSQCNPGPFL